MRVGGAPYPPGRAPYLVAASETPLTCSRCQNLLYIQKPPEHNLDREFRRQKPPKPLKANLDPFRHPAGGGNPSPVAIFIILAPSMTRME